MSGCRGRKKDGREDKSGARRGNECINDCEKKIGCGGGNKNGGRRRNEYSI